MNHAPLALLATLAMLAGCASNGGSGHLTGTTHATGAITILSADVQDGSLRSITIRNNATSPTPATVAELQLEGTSSGHAARHNATVQLPALNASQEAVVTITGAAQPDWQDGTDLTIKLVTSAGESAELTIRTV